LHELGRDPVDIAGVTSAFRYLPDRKLYRATVIVPPSDAPWIECWVGVKDPNDQLPRMTMFLNGAPIGEDDPSNPALRLNFPDTLLRPGVNTVDISYAGDALPVRGVVIAPPRTVVPRSVGVPPAPASRPP